MEESKSIFAINIFELDREWVAQPKIYFKYAKKLADARMAYEEAKASKEVVVAELDKAIRSDPPGFELGKVTEGSVEKTIVLQKRYAKATARLINAKHDMDIAEAYVDALEHKKKALENAVYLQGQNYFSKPSTTRLSDDNKEQLEGAARKAAFSKRRKE